MPFWASNDCRSSSSTSCAWLHGYQDEVGNCADPVKGRQVDRWLAIQRLQPRVPVLIATCRAPQHMIATADHTMQAE